MVLIQLISNAGNATLQANRPDMLFSPVECNAFSTLEWSQLHGTNKSLLVKCPVAVP